MAFGRKKGDAVSGGLHATALVVEADAPLDNAAPWGNVNKGSVRILIDEGSEPIYVAGSFKLDEDHWLVPGMEIPVVIDPGRPEGFGVDWDGVPSIEDRVAANDPILADPRGAQRKVVEALGSAGLAGPDLEKLPGGIGDVIARGRDARAGATHDRFEDALERASQQPSPPGKTRAVALLSAITASRVPVGDADSGVTKRTTAGRRKVVLAVNVPGREPYPVLVRRFNVPSDQGDVAGAGQPALVSSTDPNDLEVLWDELPSLQSQIGQRISDGLEGVQAEQEAVEQGMTEAIQRAIAAGPPKTMPASAPGMPQPGSEAREMMLQNAKQALQFVKDPAMRKMMIDQYRAAGIEIDEDEGT